MLTYAEELRHEGKIEGTVQTIENLLAVGADWSLITKATGITPKDFLRLKEELARLAAADTRDDAQAQQPL